MSSSDDMGGTGVHAPPLLNKIYFRIHSNSVGGGGVRDL